MTVYVSTPPPPKLWLSIRFLCFILICLSLFVSLHVLSGETLKIVIEEYVQHLSGYLLQLKFDPPLLFNSHFQYGNRIALEFSQLYHWHPLMPDSFFINGDELLYEQFLFNTSVLTRYGVEKLVDAFSRQPAGQVKTTDLITNMERETNCSYCVRLFGTSYSNKYLLTHRTHRIVSIKWLRAFLAFTFSLPVYF